VPAVPPLRVVIRFPHDGHLNALFENMLEAITITNPDKNIWKTTASFFTIASSPVMAAIKNGVKAINVPPNNKNPYKTFFKRKFTPAPILYHI